MSVKIDHVAIAVRSLSEPLAFWSEALGLTVEGIETVPTEQVRVAFLRTGESRVELLEPLSPDSPVARSITKRGEGMHHLTLAVPELRPLVERLRSRNVEILGPAPRRGAGGRDVVFVHPRSTGGVLLELVESAGVAGGGIEPGAEILLYLRDPQEKLWGVLRRLDPAGVTLEGIDLASFDDWVAQVERAEESVVGPSLLFLPIHRVERILLDRPSGHLPSLAERFERRTGRRVQDALEGESRARGPERPEP